MNTSADANPDWCPRFPEELVPTDVGLLERLRNLEDHEAWRDFFDTYWVLIHRAAIRAGLSEHEAEDVVQDTLISVSRRMETFRYEPERCSFKGWLMHVTRGHIRDRLRRRRTRARRFEPLPLETESDGAAEEIPDAAAELAFEAMRTEEWREHILSAAAKRVEPNIGLRHYEIYVLRCVKNLPVREVCQQLNVSALTVYLVSHRVARRFKREVQRLERQLH